MHKNLLASHNRQIQTQKCIIDVSLDKKDLHRKLIKGTNFQFFNFIFSQIMGLNYNKILIEQSVKIECFIVKRLLCMDIFHPNRRLQFLWFSSYQYPIEEFMEIRTLARKNTILSLNKNASLRNNSLVHEQKTEKENLPPVKPVQSLSHSALQYIRSTTPSESDMQKFAMLLYRGLHYGVKCLKGPSEAFLKKKKVRLSEPKNSSHKKILFMDLDETLIHTEFSGSAKFHDCDIELQHQGMQLHFNIRPYCFEFLQKMSKLYNVYVFTAGTSEYASIIINYLNKTNKLICGFLHRRNCMQTSNGYKIKDLRIVENRQLKDIVIVDNLAHSFGLQIENGIPILEFTDQKHDKELLGIQQLLTELAEVDDVRDYLREKLQLRKILDYTETQFVMKNQNSPFS